jgi:micrococcal nuclease
MGNKLYSLNPDKVPRIYYLGKIRKARVVSVYDGDTITVLMYWKKLPIRTNIRIYGIDTPELNSKNKRVREKALEAKQLVHELLYEKIVPIKLVKADKYGGRIVGVVYTKKKEMVSEILLEKGLAKPYFGGQKDGW